MQMLTGLVVKSLGGFYEVDTSDGTRVCCKGRGIFRKDNIRLLVGDRVEIAVETMAATDGTITSILPRRNELTRPLLANLDQLFLIVSVCDPVPNLLLLDKMIAICEHKDIIPLVVFTKNDLGDATLLEETYKKIGLFVCSLHHKDPLARALLLPLLKGKISAFSGNTGVGKSSLLNLLCPTLALLTGQTSKKLGRGRHTTRHVELHQLDDINGYVADTPGFGAMELSQYEIILKQELAHCFREFAPYLHQCKFVDCSHTVEQGCAVLSAVAMSEIAKPRHESYCTLYEQAKLHHHWR